MPTAKVGKVWLCACIIIWSCLSCTHGAACSVRAPDVKGRDTKAAQCKRVAAGPCKRVVAVASHRLADMAERSAAHSAISPSASPELQAASGIQHPREAGSSAARQACTAGAGRASPLCKRRSACRVSFVTTGQCKGPTNSAGFPPRPALRPSAMCSPAQRNNITASLLNFYYSGRSAARMCQAHRCPGGNGRPVPTLAAAHLLCVFLLAVLASCTCLVDAGQVRHVTRAPLCPAVKCLLC